jgi:hypothetical protein
MDALHVSVSSFLYAFNPIHKPIRITSSGHGKSVIQLHLARLNVRLGHTN